MWDKRILIWTTVMFLLFIPIVFAATPTHDAPTKVVDGNNLIFINHTGSGTRPLVFNYDFDYKNVDNGTRWFNNSDCVAYYPLDQDNSSDFCGNHDLFESATPVFVTDGRINGAYDFEVGDSDFLMTDNSADFRFQTQSFCIGGWIKKETSVEGGLAISATFAGTEGGWELRSDSDTTYKWTVFHSSGVGTEVVGNPVSNGIWHHVVGVYNDEQLRVLLYDNGNLTINTSTPSTIFMDAGLDFVIGGSTRAPNPKFDGIIDEVFVYKNTANCESDKIKRIFNAGKAGFAVVNESDYDGTIENYNVEMTVCDSVECGATKSSSTIPTFDDTPNTNTTVIRINQDYNISCSATDTVSLSTIIATDNMTADGSWRNFSNTTVADPTLNFNFSATTTQIKTSGTVIGFGCHVNDTNDDFAASDINTFIVAGTTPPNVTVNGNNFFASDNSTIISLNQLSLARLNFSFADDIALFGFLINITCGDDLIYNLTNISLDGPIDNFNELIDVRGPQGICKVNITVEDTHTAKLIPYYDIRKGFNWLEYDGKIRIEAEGAIWASTKKYYDRYDFRFNYLPLIGPKNKVFYIESDSPLIYEYDSIFKAHFVDYINKKWIDFEGLKGQPIVTKINDRRWKIEFENSDSKVIFNSIGGLNQDSFQFQYYLSNVSIDFFEPDVSPKTFLGTSFSVSLNVTGDGRNETRFRLYNASSNLTATLNVSATGIGTFFYNATFSGLSGTQFFVNATHIDVNGDTINSTTITFDSIQVVGCSSGFPGINFTLKDELNSSRVIGDSSLVVDYNGTTKNFQFTKSFTDQDNFSICFFPTRESLLIDYEITYQANGFPQRVATESDVTLNNITKTTDLFLLRTVDGIFATFRIIDSFQNPLSGVTSSFAKAGTTIETRETDDAGIVSFFVNPDTTYVFTFTKIGFLVSTNSLRVTTADIITITMEGEAEEQVTSFATGISYFFQPQNEILNNNTDINFRFNLTSTFWNITGCTLRLKNTTDELAQGNCQFNGSQSNVSIIFNTGNQSIIIAEVEYEINKTTNNTVSNSYRVEFVFVGKFSLKNFLDDITNFSEAAFDDFNRFIIAILIILLVVGGMSIQSADFREPEILIPVTWLMVAFFSYLGWMNIPLGTIPQIRGLPEDWLNRWNVFILISLLGGAYLIRKHLK